MSGTIGEARSGAEASERDGGRGKSPRRNQGEVPMTVLIRCFARSLFLQASWNTRGMQNLGFLHAIEPALNHLYEDEEARQRAARRHLAPFNTQPYMAEGILGGAIHHETAVAEGRAVEGRAADFKHALAGPLAAVGDTFFWAGLRPAAAAMGVALVPIIGLWAIAFMLLAYNAVHLGVRVYLFAAGLRLGDGILDAVGSMRLAERARPVKLAAVALAGLGAAMLVATVAAGMGYPMASTTTIIVVAGGLIVYPLGSRRHPYPILLAVAALGVLLGIAGVAGTT